MVVVGVESKATKDIGPREFKELLTGDEAKTKRQVQGTLFDNGEKIALCQPP